MVYVPPNTLYGPRSYRGRFLRVRWPNQQCQALKDNSWSFLHLKYSYKCNICELQSHQPHREIGTKKERNKVYKVSYKPKPYSSIPRHLANVDESRFWYAKWTYWQCNLDLWPFKPKSISLLGYPKVIPYTKLASLNTLGSIGFCLFELCSRQTNTDRQTDRQTEPNIIPTSTDFVGVHGNNIPLLCMLFTCSPHTYWFIFIIPLSSSSSRVE